MSKGRWGSSGPHSFHLCGINRSPVTGAGIKIIMVEMQETRGHSRKDNAIQGYLKALFFMSIITPLFHYIYSTHGQTQH